MSLRSYAFAPAIAIAVFVAAFAAGLLSPAGLGAGFLRALPAVLCAGLLAFGLALLFARPRWPGEGNPRSVALALVTIAALALLFGGVLASLWRLGVSGDTTFAGLLPTSDGSNYFAGALGFLHTGELSPWTTRRPLSPLLLAALLGSGGGSLRLSLAALALLGGASVAALIVFIGRRLGAWAGAIAAAVLVPFYLPSIGTAMSEHLGLALGLSGFLLMWRAAEENGAAAMFAAGAGLMALGLMARAGAMFVLPALLVYAGWRYRGTARFSLRAAALALAAMAAAFSANVFAAEVFGSRGGQVMSNFSYTLYGLVSGGHDWKHVYRDFPALAAMSESAQAKEVYRLALAHLAQQPLDALRGILLRYNDFVFNARWFRLDGIGGLRYVLAALALAGMVHVLRHRRAASQGFVLAGAVGTLLSVPFVADGGVRVHAATFAFSVSLVIFGLHELAGRFRPVVPRETAGGGAVTGTAAVIAIAAVGALSAAPFLVAPSRSPSSPTCPAGAEADILATVADGFVTVADGAARSAIEAARGRNVELPQGFSGLALPVRIGIGVSLVTPKKDAVFLAIAADGPLPPVFAACTVAQGAFRRVSGPLRID